MILGIETSCDETAAALVTHDGHVRANLSVSEAECTPIQEKHDSAHDFMGDVFGSRVHQSCLGVRFRGPTESLSVNPTVREAPR